MPEAPALAAAPGPAFRLSPLARGLRAIGVTLAVATVFGLLLASQFVLAITSSGRSVPWLAAIYNNCLDMYVWALLVPAIFWISRRFPLGRERLGLHLAVHLGGLVLAGGVYGVLQTFVSENLVPESLRPGRFLRGPREPGRDRDRDREREHSREGPRGGPRDLEGRPPFADGPGGPGGPGGPPPGPPPEGFRPPGRLEFGWERGRFRPAASFPDRALINLTFRWHLHLLTYGAVVGAWHWLAQQRRLRERDRQAQELSRQLADARLQALRMQLNPHFLFNTLNGIATVVHRDAQAADEMISSLSDFLRLTLNTANAPESPLRAELEFARRYLDIEKSRFGDRLTVVEDFPTECLTIPVPTLILQPLLENAIRHGIERSEQRGTISLGARREGEVLVLVVSDTGPGLRTPSSTRPGIGLANTRARLRELHGDAAELRLAERSGGGIEVEIRLPWRTAPA